MQKVLKKVGIVWMLSIAFWCSAAFATLDSFPPSRDGVYDNAHFAGQVPTFKAKCILELESANGAVAVAFLMQNSSTKVVVLNSDKQAAAETLKNAQSFHVDERIEVRVGTVLNEIRDNDQVDLIHLNAADGNIFPWKLLDLLRSTSALLSKNMLRKGGHIVITLPISHYRFLAKEAAGQGLKIDALHPVGDRTMGLGVFELKPAIETIEPKAKL